MLPQNQIVHIVREVAFNIEPARTVSWNRNVQHQKRVGRQQSDNRRDLPSDSRVQIHQARRRIADCDSLKHTENPRRREMKVREQVKENTEKIQNQRPSKDSGDQRRAPRSRMDPLAQ